MYSQRDLIEIKETQTKLNGNTPELVQRTQIQANIYKVNHLLALVFF